MKKRIIPAILGIVFFIALVSAITINYMSDSSTSGNFTFNYNQNFTSNFSIYNYANVTNAKVDLTGFSIDNYNFTDNFNTGASDPNTAIWGNNAVWTGNGSLISVKVAGYPLYEKKYLYFKAGRVNTSTINSATFTARILESNALCYNAIVFGWGLGNTAFGNAGGGVSAGISLSNQGGSNNGGTLTYIVANGTNADNIYSGSGDMMNWHNYTATINSTSVSWYIDGVLKLTQSSASYPTGILLYPEVKFENQCGSGNHTTYIDFMSVSINSTSLLYPSNIYLSVNNTKVYSNVGNFIGSITTNDFSSTINSALNNGLCNCAGCNLSGSNCSIPFIFHSDSIGTLQYSNINVTYYTKPFVNLVSPSNDTVSGINKTFTCSASDFSNLTNITLYIWNSTNSIFNTTTNNVSGLSNQTSFNITFSNSDTYFWNCKASNDQAYSSFNSSNYTIIVDTTTNPIINLLYPSNNQYLNYKSNVPFNCSIDGANLGSGFLVGNFNGSWAINQTKNSLITGQTNTFLTNLSDNTYLWSCSANKTTGATIYSAQQGNFTTTIDTIYPAINLTSISTNLGSQTALVNSNETDLNLASCKYSVFNSNATIDGLNNNVSFTCNNPFSLTVTAYGNFNLTVYALDLAGNENYSTSAFTVSPTPPAQGGGGGGGASPQARVVALIKPAQDLNSYTKLTRAILFSRIRNFTLLYSTTLSDVRVQYLSDTLSKNDRISISTDLLKYWVTAYNTKQYEVIEVDESQVTAYNLVKAEEIFGNAFTITPNLLNTYTFVCLSPDDLVKKQWTTQVSASKIIKNCSTMEGRFTCNLTQPSVATITYTFTNPDITFTNLEGKIQFISIDKEVLTENIQYLNVINVCGNVSVGGLKINLILIAVIIIVVIGGLIFFIIIKRRKKNSKKSYSSVIKSVFTVDGRA